MVVMRETSDSFGPRTGAEKIVDGLRPRFQAPATSMPERLHAFWD